MRLGIRRKLIGTLILVGLFPLAMSLVVVLGGGAAIQINKIRTSYEDAATDCADRISSTVREETEKLMVLSHFPRMISYVEDRNREHALANPGEVLGESGPKPTAQALELDKIWAGLPDTDPRIAAIVHNEMADRLRLLTEVNGNPRQLLVTNIFGELIAADSHTDDFFQADETWWQAAYDGGRGRTYVSSVTANPSGGDPIVTVVVPIYGGAEGKRVLIGIMKDKIPVSWLLGSLRQRATDLRAVAQLVDLDARTSVYATEEAPTNARAREFFFLHRNDAVPITTLLFNNLII
jgi:hypothetical protein